MKKWSNRATLFAGFTLAIGGGLSALYYVHSWWSMRNIVAPEDTVGLPAVKVELGTDGKTVKFTELPESGTEFARIHIDKLDVQLPITEGPHISGMSLAAKNKAEDAPLAKGAMHDKGYPWPGEIGNSILSGHNNVSLKGFKNLKNIQKGDKIKIVYSGFTFIYTVTKDGWFVDKNDTSVKSFKTVEPILRLVTCYPFDTRGEAPQRYIVEAKLTERIKNN